MEDTLLRGLVQMFIGSTYYLETVECKIEKTEKQIWQSNVKLNKIIF